MQQGKRTIRLVPNEHLRWERQRRGWSRAYIAEQIGVADPKTIGRWERGDAFPSAYFLQRLCTLFQMPAEELGLCQSEAQPLFAESPSLHIGQHNHPQCMPENIFCDPALPPAQTERLVGRDHLLCQLQAKLLAGDEAPALAALGGLPGVGKTALAVSLAHECEIRQYFSDGVLWVSLGPDADILEELKRWGRLLEIDEHEISHPENMEDWTRAIHAHIGARAMLLIIDDAWTCQDALAFKIGGTNCAYLLTTRIPAVALYFAGAGTSMIPELDKAASLKLLARFVPTLIAQEGARMGELVRLAGGLPLALQLVGTHLQAQVCSGQPRRWQAALEQLRLPEVRMQLTMPRAPLEPQAGLPADVPISLQALIELSYQQLNPATQQALIALSKLPARPESFSEETALALDGVSLEALDRLLDVGLLASVGQGRYTLHQTIVDFARFQAQLAQNMPRQMRVLRQLRSRANLTAEGELHQVYSRENTLPIMAQEPGETVTLCQN
jgi:transcriptional regulator with XRE-family HTH domain